jgi:hypothetical protein
MLAAGASVYMLKTEGSNEDIIAAILRAARLNQPS